MRIQSIAGKVGYTVISLVVIFLVAALLGFTLGTTAGAVAGSVFLIAAVVLGGRVFRGANENHDDPRAAWRLTSRPTAGWVLAALSLLQALGSGATTAGATTLAPALIAAATYVLIAVLYINSSLRLRSQGRDGAELRQGNPS